MAEAKRLNYANDAHFEMAVKRFGGEEFLRGNFPRILQMLYDTRELHRSRGEEEPSEDGYEDTFRVYELPLDSGNALMPSVYADSYMSLVNEASFLHMSSTLRDPKYQKTFDGYAVYDTNQNKIEKNMMVDHSLLSYSKNPRVEVTTDFLAVGKVNGKSVCLSDVQEKSISIDLNETGSTIQSIIVNEPRPKNGADTYIRVVYNGRKDDNAAYNFKRATDRSSGGTRYVKVFYPFSVEIRLAEGFVFEENNPVTFDSTFNLSILSDVVKGGEVHFNTAFVDQIRTVVNKNVLRLDFSYSSEDDKNYWGVEMPLTAKQADGYFDFHLNFQIHYKHGDVGGLNADVVISSEDTPQSPNRVKVKQSKILWGCLGKDTRITMADGSQREICKIRIGGLVLTDRGVQRVINVVRGREDRIVAVGIEDDRTLFITKKHPIATERGMIYAEDLTAFDRLRMEDGSFRDIRYLEVLDYHDSVYSLEVEHGGLISAENIWVGDFLTTADPVEEPENKAEPLEPELLEELIKWTELKNSQIKQEVNAE